MGRERSFANRCRHLCGRLQHLHPTYNPHTHTHTWRVFRRAGCRTWRRRRRMGYVRAQQEVSRV